MNILGEMARFWFRTSKSTIRTESEDPEFAPRLDRIANQIAYEQPLDSANPLEVVAAQLRMEWNR